MSEVEPEVANTIEAEEPVNELPPIEEEAPKAEPIIETTQEIKPVKPLKNNSKTQARNEKKITCPKCAKTLTLKSYRYSHERNCQGPLESKPIKSIKSKANQTKSSSNGKTPKGRTQRRRAICSTTTTATK